MTLNEFRGEFGGTPRRDFLINELEQEMRAIVAAGHSFSAAVFGSMVSEERKESPGDIDVLLCVAAEFAAPKWEFRHDDLHVKGTFRMAQFDPEKGAGAKPACLTLSELVERFNASTRNLDEDIAITINDCVEVTL